MTSEQLFLAVEKAKEEMKLAMQTIYDALNNGQQKQIIKNEKVKQLFDLYGVNYKE